MVEAGQHCTRGDGAPADRVPVGIRITRVKKRTTRLEGNARLTQKAPLLEDIKLIVEEGEGGHRVVLQEEAGPRVLAEGLPQDIALGADDLSGLPPALLLAGEFDPLLSETEAYAARLQAAGVPATFTHYPGASHNFYSMPPTVDVAVRAMTEIIDALKAAFGSAVKA